MEHDTSRDERTAAPASGSAVASMYDAHIDEVYRFVHRRCRDHALAEDITQETFLAAVRRTGDPGAISIGWLLTVARNHLVDVLRRDARYAGKLRLVAEREPSSDLETELAERLRVEGALSQLRVDYRLVLTLHYLDGLTVPALADHLGRSVKSVEGLVTRARRELRAALGDDGRGTDETGEARA